MISHKHKLIFIHIPKCAGTSVENALGHYDNHTADRGGQDHRSIRMIEQPLFSTDLFRSRENIRELVRRVRHPYGNIYNPNNRLTVTRAQYDDYYKFTFVRNPWARVYSWYRNVINDPVHRKNYGLNKETPFGEYLENYAGKGMIQTQTYWLKNFAGKIPLDFIGRFENLSDDFLSVCASRGLGEIKLPHKIKGSSKDYREVFDQRSRELVNRIYKEEIDLFGYTFDG